MRHSPHLWAICGLTLAWPIVGLGQYYLGTDMVELCDGTHEGEPNEDMFKYNKCVTDLQEWLDTYRQYRICPKGEVTSEELREVWLRWAADNQEELHHGTFHLAVEAFAQQWPCQE